MVLGSSKLLGLSNQKGEKIINYFYKPKIFYRSDCGEKVK